MKRFLIPGSLAVFALSGIFFTDANASCKVIDDNGREVQLQKPAQRVISLSPDITETLFSIGAGGHVLGVIQGSDYPEAAKKIPVVGSYAGLDLEKIFSLHPDLIVSWGKTFARQISALTKMGIPVYSSEPVSLTDISRTMNNLGCLTGKIQSAEHEAKRYSQRLDELGKRYSNKKNISVFYQIGSYSLITINHDSWINQVISLCGGTNIFAEAKLAAPEVSWESVVTANPQVIVSDAENANWKSRWSRWSAITAVKNKNLFSINPDIIERASPRLLNGAEQMCEDFQKARLTLLHSR